MLLSYESRNIKGNKLQYIFLTFKMKLYMGRMIEKIHFFVSNMTCISSHENLGSCVLRKKEVWLEEIKKNSK